MLDFSTDVLFIAIFRLLLFSGRVLELCAPRIDVYPVQDSDVS